MLILATGLSFGSGVAKADDPIEEDYSTWQPRFDATFGVHSQVVRSHVQRTTGVTGRESRDILASIFKFSTGVVSPSISEEFGKPRFYGRVGYHYVISTDDIRILDSNFSVSTGDYNSDPGLCGINQEPTTSSCDHSLTIDVDIENMWSAELGVEFSAEIWEQEFKLSTGIAYLGQEMTYKGLSVKNDRESFPTPGLIAGTFVIPKVRNTDIIHTIGPSVSLAASVGQIGPISIQFFGDLGFFFYLDDDDEILTGSESGDVAVYRVEKEAYLTEATAGIRLSWY
jgi:hypothetical protein